MAFPTARDFNNLFGVSDEDHEKWEQRHAQLQAARQKRGTVQQMIDQTAEQAIGLGKMMVQAKLYGRESYAAEAEYEEGHERRTRTNPDGTTTTESVPKAAPEKDFVEQQRDAVPPRRSRVDDVMRRQEATQQQPAAADDDYDY